MPALGTVMWVHVRDAEADAAEAADRAAVAAVIELEGVFSAYRADSSLSRWRSGATAVPDRRLVEVLDRAETWRRLSDGAFNVATGDADRLWSDAAAADRWPQDVEIDRCAAGLALPRYTVEDGTLRRLGDTGGIVLNALAKGTIVDAALDAAVRTLDSDTATVLVNLGGDLAVRGPAGEPVGIENPFRPYDNEPPIDRVILRNSGMATSGSARRGYEIGGRRVNHVIDPRTARPVEHVVSASVIAPSAETADAIATVLSVLGGSDGCAWLDRLGSGIEGPVAALCVDADGTRTQSAGWGSRRAN